jgi:hypothetical protein
MHVVKIPLVIITVEDIAAAMQSRQEEFLDIKTFLGVSLVYMLTLIHVHVLTSPMSIFSLTLAHFIVLL